MPFMTWTIYLSEMLRQLPRRNCVWLFASSVDCDLFMFISGFIILLCARYQSHWWRCVCVQLPLCIVSRKATTTQRVVLYLSVCCSSLILQHVATIWCRMFPVKCVFALLWQFSSMKSVGLPRWIRPPSVAGAISGFEMCVSYFGDHR